MPHKKIQKILSYVVNFLRKTSFKHKKKLIFLTIIALLSYIAKKKLSIVHLLKIAQKISQLLSYIPLPTFPQYRKVNRYEHIQLNALAQISQAMNIDEIKQRIRQKKTDWNQLKESTLTGVILAIVLYNIQEFYCNVQNKYEADFMALDSAQLFQMMMSQLRKKFLKQIPDIMTHLSTLLRDEIQCMNIKTLYSYQQYCLFVETAVEKVFDEKYVIVKQENQLLENNFYKNQQYFKKAQNYFLSSYEYMPDTENKLVSGIKKLSSFISKLTSGIFPRISCQVSSQRYNWSMIGYRVPLKKSISQYEWINKQSQLLSKFVLKQIDQLTTSLNFSILLKQYATLNCSIVKNRLFLYFKKQNIEKLRLVDALNVLYKIVKEQILQANVLTKRQKFYQSQILKAFKEKSHLSTDRLLIQNINRQQTQQMTNPAVLIRNMHLQEIYQANQFDHLIKQFQIKYFNEREKVTLNPVAANNGTPVKPSEDDNQMKKLLTMLQGNQQLMKKE